MVHELKILPLYFEAVALREKTFEIRVNDRDYHVGDTLLLKEWENGNYTGREISRYVNYIYYGDGTFGIPDGVVIMNLKLSATKAVTDTPQPELKGSERLLKGKTEPTISKMEQVDEPITQTKTQNSNLTLTEGVWNAGYKTGYDKGYKDAQKVKDSQDLVKDLVKAFGEDGTWLERQGVYTMTLAEAKQRAVDIVEAVLRKDEADTPQMDLVEDDKCFDCEDFFDCDEHQTDCPWK